MHVTQLVLGLPSMRERIDEQDSQGTSALMYVYFIWVWFGLMVTYMWILTVPRLPILFESYTVYVDS